MADLTLDPTDFEESESKPHHQSTKRSSSSSRHRRSSGERKSSRHLSSRSSSDRQHREDETFSGPSSSRGSSERFSGSSRSSSRDGNRRNSHDGSSNRRSYRRSSSERSSSDRRRTKNRSHHSTAKPSRTQSVEAMATVSEHEEVIPKSKSKSPPRHRPKSKSPSRHRSKPSAQASVSDLSAISTLYGNDEDAKAKASSHRATNPGVEQIDSNSKATRSLNTLYGSDLDAKAKAKASIGSSQHSKAPGIQQVFGSPTAMDSTKHSAATSTLYGMMSDADAKQKATALSSGGSPSRVVNPSSDSVWKKAKSSRGNLEQMMSPSSHTISTKNSAAINTLYGDNDADTKAKAKASKGSDQPASNPGIETVFLNNSTHTSMSTLYGSVADDKAKARASRGWQDVAHNPGAESVVTTRTVDTLYGHDAEAKAMARMGGSSVLAANNSSVALNTAITSLTESARSSSISATNDDDGQPETNEAQEPVARRVSIGSTDSESASHEHPERRSGAKGGSSEAMEGFQMPNDPETGSKHHRRSRSKNKGATEETPERSRLKKIILFLLLLLLVGGGAAVWYFLFRETDTGEVDLASNTNIQDTTVSPSSSSGASISPEQPKAATMAPSAAPSIGLLYDPPSGSDCLAISENRTIAGRDTRENADFELGVEVVLSENNSLTEPLLQDLLDAIQEKILPSLAGCKVMVDELMEAWRYVIFDAFVTGSVRPGASCEDEVLKELNCHRVSVKLDLFLKGNVRFLDIVALISEEEENISNHLDLIDPFSIVKLIGAKSLIPTDSPTRMPTDAPSFSPTDVPTLQASSTPTATSSALPTRTPTLEPSLSPSGLPSVANSMMPSTTSPTTTPSFKPSGAPSESPSVRPSITSSRSPTQSPTTAPSAKPSKAPSLQPSTLPSKSPTRAPSTSPTLSLAPSVHPSSKPTSAPSASLSRSPTIAPSAQPSITSFHWVTCGRLGNCGGRPASLENSNFKKLGGTGSEIAVRCCSDVILPGFTKRYSTCPYAESPLNGVCYNIVSYHEADSLCSGLGGRLCTQAEVEADCTRGSGCGHDNRMIWTSDGGP